MENVQIQCVFQIQLYKTFIYSKKMNQEQIPKNLSKIQSLISNNQRPQKILSLFYTTTKYIEKKQVTSQKSSYLSSTCFSFYDSDQQLKDCITKYSCKVQDLFNQFLQKNRKLSSQLDKVNSHMLKITSQMITNINQRKLSVLYEKQQNEEPINSRFQVNRMQRVRSMSLFSKFQNLFTNTLDQRNNSPNENVQDHLQQARTEPKIPPRVSNIKASRLSQKTIESTSSQQNRNSNHQQTPPPKPSTQTLVSIQTILNLYAQHKLDRAFQLLTKLQSNHPETIQRYNEEHTSPNNPNKLTELKQEHEEMIKFYNDFDLKGYKLDKKEDNITMHYKILEKQNLVAIQVQSQVDLTIEKFLCIASEIQLYDKYVPFNYETTCLREVARNKKIGRSKVFIPLLNNRQAYFEAKAYDRLDTQNCIFIFSKNLKKQHLNELSIEYKSQGLIDLDYIFFLLSYTPITKQKGKIRMATCIDLKISILPKFILNKTARIFAFDYFKNMISINRRFAGSPWEKAISNKPEHYSFFREKITQYFEQKDTKQ